MRIQVLTSVVQMAVHKSIDLLKMCLGECTCHIQLAICGFPLALSQQGPFGKCASTRLLSVIPA